MPIPKLGPPIPPTIIEKVPLSVIRALNVTDILIRSTEHMKSQTNIGLIFAFGSIDSYLAAAKRQQRRIKQAGETRINSFRSRKHKHYNLFNEIHFYLICWARIAKLARFIAEKTRFRQVGLVLRRYSAELKARIDCRDHLEHFEERLPGGKNQKKLLVPNDLLNMKNEYLTYGGRKLNVGPESLILLKTIVAELHQAILFDAIETLANTDIDRLATLINQTAISIQIGKRSKYLQKIWNNDEAQKEL